MKRLLPALVLLPMSASFAQTPPQTLHCAIKNATYEPDNHLFSMQFLATTAADSPDADFILRLPGDPNGTRFSVFSGNGPETSAYLATGTGNAKRDETIFLKFDAKLNMLNGGCRPDDPAPEYILFPQLPSTPGSLNGMPMKHRNGIMKLTRCR